MANEKKFSRETICNTPHGGVRMVASFFDKGGNPCIEADAVKTLITEYDKNDVIVFSVMGER